MFNFITISHLLGNIKLGTNWKLFLDFGGNLKVRQFSNIFYANDMFRQSFVIKAFSKLELRISRTKNLNLYSILNMHDNLVIVFTEMIPESPVAYIFW